MNLNARALACICLSALSALIASGAEKQVVLRTSDGQDVQASVYGSGDTALVLCHGRAYTTGAASFEEQCRYLEKKGIQCLALSFRGYPAEAPPVPVGADRDVLAAVKHLADLGTKRIFVLGSSMGGFIALQALPDLETVPQFSGVVLLSAFDNEAIRNSGIPKLFVAAEDDRQYYRKVLACFENDRRV